MNQESPVFDFPPGFGQRSKCRNPRHVWISSDVCLSLGCATVSISDLNEPTSSALLRQRSEAKNRENPQQK